MASAGVARVGDTGSSTINCSLHTPSQSFTYTWTTGSTTIDILGIGVIRVGDTCPSSCGHTVIAFTGAGFSSGDNGGAIHRVGDIVHIQEGGTGVGVTNTGSGIVDAA
jgi:hypothetical protein